MIKNYIVIAIRNIRRQKVSSLINILGLAIGITCSFLIFLYIQTELSFDKFYPNSENIYRLGCTNNMGGKIDSYCNAPRPTSPLMKTEFPEVIENTRVCGMNGLYTHKADFIYKEQTISSEKSFGADSTFFNVFRHEFISGIPEEALIAGNSVVLTESFAKTIFGNEEPFGKTVTVERYGDYTVTGIIKDFPGRSHFEFDAIFPWDNIYRFTEENSNCES